MTETFNCTDCGRMFPVAFRAKTGAAPAEGCCYKCYHGRPSACEGGQPAVDEIVRQQERFEQERER